MTSGPGPGTWNLGLDLEPGLRLRHELGPGTGLGRSLMSGRVIEFGSVLGRSWDHWILGLGFIVLPVVHPGLPVILSFLSVLSKNGCLFLSVLS